MEPSTIVRRTHPCALPRISQTMGFGQMAFYHANNEQGLLSDFAKGFKVLTRLLERLN
jgi:hypothetical protein